MSWIWTALLGISILSAYISGNGPALSSATLTGAQGAVTLALGIAGSICLWCGIAKLLEKSGITGWLSRRMMPVLCRIFPSARKNALLAGALCGNICANLLGLGNAATPLGIQAAKEMKDPQVPERATDELCRLIVLNTASIQLIPANVAAIRSELGAGSPFDILPAVWITSICSAGLGLLAAVLLGKVWHRG